MDLLVCPECARRFTVRGGGDGSGWLCRHCHAELRMVERADSARPFGTGSAGDWHLHYLHSLPDLPDPQTNVPTSPATYRESR